MGQFVGAIQGITEACKVLNYPVVSGNVSLYNETDGQAILPTPTIGGVGLLKDYHYHAHASIKRENDILCVIGSIKGTLGCSDYLFDALGKDIGLPPTLDLEKEKLEEYIHEFGELPPLNRNNLLLIALFRKKND